ncbi:CHAP domain-containing protein [Mediterraneibacter faecis]|uniref:CHAP domain-containing protein n=1 Tax=Mediterraneibacter faecis TaxID=592978 RepID=UPI003CE78A82
MGKGIKTRVAEKGIKAIDKAAVASERMKEAYIRTRDKADHSLYAAESSPGEYASDRLSSGVDNVAHEAIHQFDKQGRKGIKTTKENISKVKENIQKRKAAAAQPKKQAEKQAARKTRQAADRISEPVRTLRQERGAVKTLDRGKKSIKTVDRGRKTIKQASSTAKGTVKTASKSIKTAEKTAKASIKTTQQAAKAAQRTAQATARAARAAAHAARAAARAAVAAAKVAAKATIAAVKAIIAATKALIAAIAAGGWIAVLVIVIICLIGLLIGSCFGIFFSGEDSGSGYTMQNVVQEINDDYQQQIDTTKANLSHDVLEMSGSRAVWPEVLAVYAVKTTTDPDNPQEVATIDDSKKAILTDIFWEMNQISSRTETRTETVITETDDGNGNIVETESTVTQTYLYITVSHKTAEEMAAQYGFDEEQKEQLAELLAEENRSLWSAVLYGIYTEDGAIVSVALSQVGNVGGEPYWSWYGFDSRVEWCACFVSWCANECGYIDTGVIPKYAGCVNGVQWFKDRGQWLDNSAEPAPGMIIFFDWDDENGQDGLSDHTGIVEKVENGRVYTIEGNSGDSVRQNSYPVGHYEVLGYGCPDF